VIATVLLLLVEDEPLILDMMQCVFEDAGYRIEVAVDGASAMALIDAHIDEAAGLVTDVRLGSGPDGWDVARHARHKKPDMPVLYMTGDSAANWAAQGGLDH
jgi:DNA-binding NtrC family response regulator